jgi:hypothetical protein
MRIPLIDIKKKLLCLGFIFSGVLASSAEEWTSLYDVNQNEIEVRIIAFANGVVTVERKKDRKVFKIPLTKLADDSREIVESWESGVDGGTGGGSAKPPRKVLDLPADLPTRLYPRTLLEIQDGLEEITTREGKSGFAENQVAAVNVLNAYRFLSGISSDVELDRAMVEGATDAGNACQKHGSLSHDLGHSTESCNLHMGQSSIKSSVRGYINDPGPNNRDERGHRMWCLFPSMSKTGFGESENKGFFGMWAHDHGGKNARDFWAYPGEGLYPLSYCHGNAWSCYLTENAPSVEDLKVEVYRLSARPEKPFGTNDEIPGEALPVSFVFTYDHVINFEPTGKKFDKPGIYYVRIKGGGVKEAYLVELIDL